MKNQKITIATETYSTSEKGVIHLSFKNEAVSIEDATFQLDLPLAQKLVANLQFCISGLLLESEYK